MARKTLAGFDTLWQKHENLYCELFRISLMELARKKSSWGDEDAISELLCAILSKKCFDLSLIKNIEIKRPNWELPIQPLNKQDLKGGKFGKRPDFTCNCHNPLANSHEDHEIPFHVECKRIGSPTSPLWILNKNYVKNGIARFDCYEHEYGKRASSGLMVGYMVSQAPERNQTEVNEYQKIHLPRNPSLEFELKEQCLLHQSRQILHRAFIKPFNFRLLHIWIDLRF